MSEADDRLREMAANRGCKLVKSRRRKPGGDFGRYGLKEAKSGKHVLGFGGKGLTATAEEVEEFLRGGAAASWESSLGVAAERQTAPRRGRAARPAKAATPPRRPPAKPKPARHRDAPPERAKRPRARPEPESPPPPQVREAMPRDAAVIARLVNTLGYEVSEGDLRKRLAQLRKVGEPPLVAARGGVIGCLTWHVTPVLHRPRPVGRITMLVVAEEARGEGVGTLLVAAAEARLREQGCGLIEVTSNRRRMRAHAFYEKLGFERTSYRFARALGPEPKDA